MYVVACTRIQGRVPTGEKKWPVHLVLIPSLSVMMLQWQPPVFVCGSAAVCTCAVGWIHRRVCDSKRARHAFRREISLISLLSYQLDKFKVLCSPCDLFPFNWKNSLQCAASTTHCHSHTIIHLNIPLQCCHRASILQTLHENSITHNFEDKNSSWCGLSTSA